MLDSRTREASKGESIGIVQARLRAIRGLHGKEGSRLYISSRAATLSVTVHRTQYEIEVLSFGKGSTMGRASWSHAPTGCAPACHSSNWISLAQKMMNLMGVQVGSRESVVGTGRRLDTLVDDQTATRDRVLDVAAALV